MCTLLLVRAREQVAISLKPSWAKGYYRAGLALAALNRAADAVDNLKRALALDPSNKTVVTKIAEVGRAAESRPMCGARTAQGSHVLRCPHRCHAPVR